MIKIKKNEDESGDITKELAETDLVAEADSLAKEPESGVTVTPVPEISHEVEVVFKPYKPESPHTWVYLFAGTVVIFIFLSIAIFMNGEKTSHDTEKSALWINNEVSLKTDNYEIHVTKITDEIMNDSRIPNVMPPDDILKNQFYALSIKLVQGCMTKNSLESLNKRVFFVGKEGKHDRALQINLIDELMKIIYKSNIGDCGDFGAVFVKFFVYHNKNTHVTGLSIDGLEKNYPVEIKWE